MNVLLVEDDASLVELISLKMEELGFLVISAASGADALIHLKKQTPDLMLLDYSLPDINGKELIETIKNQQIHCPPFIMTTGQGDERIAVDMMKLGAMDYLVKDMLFLEKLPDVVKRVFKEIESADKLKQAEEALIENDVRFRAFMNASNDGTFIKDDNFRYLFANEQAARLFNTTTTEIIGKTDADFAKLIDINTCHSSDIRALESIEQFTINEQLGDRVFEITKLPLQLQNNKKGIGGIIKDITERKLAEKALMASEEKFKSLMQQSPFVVELYNLNGLQIFVNKAYEELWDFPADTTLNKFNVLKSKEVENTGLIVYVNRAYAGESVVVPEYIFNPTGDTEAKGEGRERWLSTRIYPLKELSGKVVNIVIVHQDITDRKLAEEALRESEERFRNAITYAPYPIMIHADGEVLQLSDEWTQQTGYTIDDISTIKEWANKAYGKNAVPSIEFINNLSDIDKTQHDGEWIVKIKNGSNRIWDFRSSPIGKLSNGKKMIISMASDITERKQAEEKIRATEEKYRTMIETSNDIIWMLDHNGNITFINAHAEKLTGYLLKNIKGNLFTNFIAEDELSFMKDVFLKTMLGEKMSYEMNLKTAYGNTLILAVNTAPLSVEGEKRSVFSFARDITQQKEAEYLLKESETRFKALHNASFGGVAIYDSGVIKDCNQGLSDITGYSLEELIGMDGLLFIAEDYRDIVKQNILSSYKKDYEVVGIRKNGGELPLRIEGRNIPYKGKNMRVVEFRDISEQKKAEDAIRRLSIAVQQSPSVIVITDINGDIEFVNPKFTELTGYTSLEAIGQKSSILKSGEQESQFYKEMWETIESGKVWRGQFHNKKKNGELFWEAASISAILNEAGEVINYIKIGEDISQQKQTETELKIALEKALESDRLKSAFLTNMSHEIRTPMNGILGFINLLNESDLSKLEIDQYSAIINKSGKRLLNTINDIIDISRIEAGEMVISKTVTFINNMMEELDSFYSPQAKQKGLSLILKPNLANEKISVVTDSHKLHGILTNFIKNAIKYTEKGYITFGYLVKENFIEFYVKDTGIGIPKNRTKAIFNRFEQADIEDSMVLEGSGLGLAISKAYAEMIEGEISVESEEGIGSKFVLTIPYTNTTKKEIEKITEITNNGNSKFKDLNLLIVEDDDVSSQLFETLLAGIFNEIIVVTNGKEAIDICRNNPEINLVLMDIKMPKMDGYTATRKIREFNKDLVIIAQTAYAMQGDTEKAIKAGCNDYISKPIDKELLLEIISNHIGKKKH